MIKIIAIDDEPQFTDMIRNYFEPRGYQVFVAANGHIGLDLVVKEKPEIALIDLKMPGIRGDQVLEEIGKVSPSTSSIMITASEGDEKIRESFFAKGAFECFDKPLASLKVLESKIKEALANGKARA